MDEDCVLCSEATDYYLELEQLHERLVESIKFESTDRSEVQSLRNCATSKGNEGNSSNAIKTTGRDLKRVSKRGKQRNRCEIAKN